MPGTRQPTVNRELVTVTADVTLTNFDLGKTVCNVGASGAVIITLPAPGACTPGGDILVLACAAQNLTVAGAANGDLITFGDVAANSVALSTGSEQAGGAFLITCVGSKWHVAELTGETQTVTVAT